jgi:hypothetical protein
VKHGGVYTSHPDGQLTARISDSSLVTKYAFGTKTAEFYLCAVCGAVPFVTSLIDGNEYAVVNVNTFEGVESADLSTTATDFDGESVGDRLARRKRKWIPRVCVESTDS